MASASSQRSSPVRTRRSAFEFEFDDSKLENLPVGEFVSSPTFTVGDYDWALQYYPQGDGSADKQFSCIHLSLRREVKNITVWYYLELLDNTGKFVTICTRVNCYENNKYVYGPKNLIFNDGLKKIFRLDGVYVISCSITGLAGPKSCQTTKAYPGGLCEHMEKLLVKGERFDVTFEVEGESISAHRFMLAARSPVFEAQLFGPMAESTMEHIKIDEMNAQVFKALIHFVYTDELAKDRSNDQGTLSVELLQNLFVAADRYALDKLTLICEEQLENIMSVDNVVTTLLLADRYILAKLKKKCLDFASSPENFLQVVVTKEYLNIMFESPSLLAELSEKVKCLSCIAKKQRTV